MRFTSFVVGLATVAALSSCQMSTEKAEDVATPAADACGATELSFVAGMTATDVDFGTRTAVRVLGPDSVATTDYNPERLNVMTDKSGNITSLSCG